MDVSEAIPTDVAEAIQSLLASGKYATAADVLRNALAALHQRDADVAAIAAGLADMEAGRIRPFDELDAEFRTQHNFRRGQ